MYTKKSVDLKSDFYARYGENRGKLFFERVGIPCELLGCDTRKIVFAMDCGARAYGRRCGDALKVADRRSSVCHTRFAPDGYGAQILYEKDIDNLDGADNAAEYAVCKLMQKMRVSGASHCDPLTHAADIHGRNGSAAYCTVGSAQSLPLPLEDYNVFIVRTGAHHRRSVSDEERERFCRSEAQRIETAAEGLRMRRVDILFDMMERSLRSMLCLMNPSSRNARAADLAAAIPGIAALRITPQGVVCICHKDAADNAAQRTVHDYTAATGYNASVTVVK